MSGEIDVGVFGTGVVQDECKETRETATPGYLGHQPAVLSVWRISLPLFFIDDRLYRCHYFFSGIAEE